MERLFFGELELIELPPRDDAEFKEWEVYCKGEYDAGARPIGYMRRGFERPGYSMPYQVFRLFPGSAPEFLGSFYGQGALMRAVEKVKEAAAR